MAEEFSVYRVKKLTCRKLQHEIHPIIVDNNNINININIKYAKWIPIFCITKYIILNRVSWVFIYPFLGPEEKLQNF